MVLAELEVFQSRPIAPTRRLALGDSELPVSPAPGFGGILLAGIAAAFVDRIDPELRGDLVHLTHQLEEGRRIPQPRLRHRFQVDRIGLNRRVHRLSGDGERLRFDLDDRDGTSPAPQVLAAVYAAGMLAPASRPAVMGLVRRGLAWRGGDDALVEYLTGRGVAGGWLAAGAGDPVAWALGVLCLDEPVPGRAVVQRRFRELLRDAHPDHGGAADDAAQRITELSEARRILLAS
ncbi:MAG: hypothetical protein HYX34_06425 [Actinobacteria bacterium]|nr:hypothetical protein [Actinomycetota bacterium]